MMKHIWKLVLAALTLPLGACSMAPSFDIRVVDAATGAPMGGVAIRHKTTHFTWPKRWDVSEFYLGKAGGDGMFTVGRLDMDKNTHRFTFAKAGYRNMYIFAKTIRDQDVYWISNGLKKNGKIESGSIQPIAGSPTVEVRMSRGHETRGSQAFRDMVSGRAAEWAPGKRLR